MSTWMTSDLHFHHKRIVELTGRPVDQQHHTEWLIDRLNSIIKPTDIVYSLGDFCFKNKPQDYIDIMSQLHGDWRHLVGNHDSKSGMEKATEYVSEHNCLGYYYEANLGFDFKTVLCHYPFEVWNQSHRGSVHLHGHMHGRKESGGRYLCSVPNRMDVCLDANPEFRPFNMDEIAKYLGYL